MCDAIGRPRTSAPRLRRNLGEVIGLLPLPSSEAAIESVTQGGLSYVVVLRLPGESEEVQVQTRWKDRDGQPTLVEASHPSRSMLAPTNDETGGLMDQREMRRDSSIQGRVSRSLRPRDARRANGEQYAVIFDKASEVRI
jgi:hypothetical protein